MIGDYADGLNDGYKEGFDAGCDFTKDSLVIHVEPICNSKAHLKLEERIAELEEAIHLMLNCEVNTPSVTRIGRRTLMLTHKEIEMIEALLNKGE